MINIYAHTTYNREYSLGYLWDHFLIEIKLTSILGIITTSPAIEKKTTPIVHTHTMHSLPKSQALLIQINLLIFQVRDAYTKQDLVVPLGPFY